jgi:hypothetical protein
MSLLETPSKADRSPQRPVSLARTTSLRIFSTLNTRYFPLSAQTKDVLKNFSRIIRGQSFQTGFPLSPHQK